MTDEWVREPPTERRLGTYVLKSRLGVGGMGEVFLAHDSALDRPVAVKVLASEFKANETLIARFRREAQAVARLNHPNIVQVYTVDVEATPPYMAMEYVQGMSLDRLLQQEGPLSWQRALTICGQVASALECAHGQGIVHRDIKPANILLDEKNRARVTDFGIAKVAHAQTELTSTGTIIGSPWYMSPEQCGVGEVGPASDLFSLGTTVYELIAGKLPFEAETAAGVVKQVTLDPAPPLTEHVPDVPRDVQDFIAGLMAKNPGQRYVSAKHVLEDLRDLQANVSPKHLPVLIDTSDMLMESPVKDLLDVQATPAPVLMPPPDREFPWRTVLIVSAVLVAMLMLFAGFRTLLVRDTPTERLAPLDQPAQPIEQPSQPIPDEFTPPPHPEGSPQYGLPPGTHPPPHRGPGPPPRGGQRPPPRPGEPGGPRRPDQGPPS